MGLFSRFFGKTPDKDKFARMLLKRIRQSGDRSAVKYSPESFTLHAEDKSKFYLRNIYQSYLKSPANEREQAVRRFLSIWHTSKMEKPQDFADARSDIMPGLRARDYFEVGIHAVAEGYRAPFDTPYQEVAEHFAAALFYDLPTSMSTLDDRQLDEWGVSFYEAMEIALRNLRDRTTEYSTLGNLIVFDLGDGYDATRLLLTEMIDGMEMKGDPIAMAPHRDLLLICGSDDSESLAEMVKHVQDEVDHERFISGMALRLVDNQWELWMPPSDNPLYADFRLLELQSLARTYFEEKEMLELRHASEGTDVFVASFSILRNKKSGKAYSSSIWTEGVDALLPKTDRVVLAKTHGDGVEIAAHGSWEEVERIVGDLMEPNGTYPERKRVRAFPNDAALGEIGNPPM